MEATPTPSRIFRRLLGILRPQWAMVGFALVLLFVSMPGELFPAFIWAYVTDVPILRIPGSTHRLHPLISLFGKISDPVQLLISACILLFVVYTVSLVASTFSTVMLQRVAQKFVFVLRNKVYEQLQSQSLGYLQRQRIGDLMSRAMGDIDELQNFIVNSIDMIVGDGVLWIATVGIVFYYSWRVSAASLAPLVIVYLMLRVFNKKVKPIYAAVRGDAGDVTTRLQENLSGITVIKIFGREKQEAGRFQQTTDGYFRQQIKAIIARNLFFR